MEKELKVIPECYVDSNLISTLLGGIGVNHQKGCNMVTGVMKNLLVDKFAIGVIDDDKVTPSYLDEFHEVANRGHLQIYKHDKRSHYVVKIHKAVEDFILDETSKAGLHLEDFGLPSNLAKLKQQTKVVSSDKDLRFRRLFLSLSTEGEFALLRDVLRYLLDKQFTAEEEDIKTTMGR